MDKVLRPVLTASRPSQTMAQMGPLSMSGNIPVSKNVASLKVDMWSSSRGGFRQRLTCNEALEKGLVGKIFVVFLQVLLGGRRQLDGGEFIARERISRDEPAE